MSESYFMLQCLLTKKNEWNGNNMLVSWLPEKYAVKGKVLKIKNKNDEWEDNWIVDTVYTTSKLNMENLMISPQCKYTQVASDI